VAVPVITAVTPISFVDGQAGVVIDGSNFNPTQGFVELGDAADHSGTNVLQTVTAWSDTQITITVVQGALASGTVYVFVTNSDPATNGTGFAVILADAAKAVTDVGVGAEASMLTFRVLRRLPTGTALSSIADSLGAPGQKDILIDPTTKTFIWIYQAGNQGATGLVFRQSTDGINWGSETQISSRQNVYPSAAINPSTGDVHVAYGLLGDPSLAASHSIWYRVLAFNGTTWVPGGETTIEAGSSSNGFSNPTLFLDSRNGGGKLNLAYYKKTSSASIVRLAVSSGAWDLSSNTKTDEITLPSVGLTRIVGTRGLDGTSWERTLLVEQTGTYRLYTAASSTGFTLQASFVGTSSDSFDIVWNPSKGSGVFGIVDLNTPQVRYRTYNPITQSFSTATVIASSGGISCAIARDGAEFIIALTRQASGNQNFLQVCRTNNTNVVYTLDEDPGLDSWGRVKLCRDTQTFDMVVLAWCDTADPGANQYNVYIGSVAIDIFRNISDANAGSEKLANGPAATDAGAGNDGNVVAGEAKGPVTDTGAGTDTIPGFGPQIVDTGTGIEALAQVLQLLEAGAGTEAVAVGPALTGDSVAGTESVAAVELVIAADTGATAEIQDVGPAGLDVGGIAEVTIMIIPLSDAGAGVDEVARLVPVDDTGMGTESFDAGGGGFNVAVTDLGRTRETFGGSAGSAGRQRYDLLAIAGSKLMMHPGPSSALGWDRRATVPSETSTKLACFEDIDPAYANIAFVLTRVDSTRWDRIRRSTDQGRTLDLVGPNMISDIAHGPDGTLWAVGNDGSDTALVLGASTGLFCPNSNGTFGYAVTNRMIFKSLDKGASWTRVYTDPTPGAYCRYSHLVNIAVDPENRDTIVASGVDRGAVGGWEVQFVRSTDGGRSWTRISAPQSVITARLNGGGWHEATLLRFLAGGRLLFAATAGTIFPGHNKIWISDDLGETWTVAYDFDNGGNAPWTDLAQGGGRIWALKNGGFGDNTTQELLLYSTDNGASWSPLDIPDHTDGHFTSIAYDSKLDVLYIGTQKSTSPVWRQDDPNTGGWINILEDLPQASLDDTPTVPRRGMAILATITGLIEASVSDVASILEAMPIGVLVEATGQAGDTVAFEFNITDAAQVAELLKTLQRQALTVRIFMHRGRAIVRLEGASGPAVTGNPGG
jgi:hypothetical protein